MKVYHINIRVFITLINQQFDVLIINTEIKFFFKMYTTVKVLFFMGTKFCGIRDFGENLEI